MRPDEALDEGIKEFIYSIGVRRAHQIIQDFVVDKIPTLRELVDLTKDQLPFRQLVGKKTITLIDKGLEERELYLGIPAQKTNFALIRTYLSEDPSNQNYALLLKHFSLTADGADRDVAIGYARQHLELWEQAEGFDQHLQRYRSFYVKFPHFAADRDLKIRNILREDFSYVGEVVQNTREYFLNTNGSSHMQVDSLESALAELDLELGVEKPQYFLSDGEEL